MTVSLLDLNRAAQARALALTAETAGYLVLAVIDAGGLRQCTTPSEMVLLDSGEIRLGAAMMSDHPAAPERALRSLLGQLLALCSVAHPVLSEVSRAERQGSLARELEAALIPVNRAAGRRTLARACRDTERAKRAGKLNDVAVIEVQPQAPAAVAPVASSPASNGVSTAAATSPPKVERRRQPRSVSTTTQQAAASSAPRIVEAPVAVEPAFTSVEHTVRIDQLRSNAAASVGAGPDSGAVAKSAAKRGRAAVADRRGEPRATGRRLNDVRAALEQHGKTPFLGSVVTEMRDQPLEHDTQIDPEVLPVEPVASPEPQHVSAPQPAPEEAPPPFLANPTPPPPPFVANVPPISVIENAPALTHTPPWQPNVAPLLRSAEPQVAPVVTAIEEHSEPNDLEVPDASALVVGESNASSETDEQAEPEAEPWIASESESSPLEEAEGFFLLLDEAGSSKPPTVAVEQTELVEVAQSQGEPVDAPVAEQSVDQAFADDLEDETVEAPDEVLLSEPPSKAPLYSPRKTELADLFAELEHPDLEQDVAHELKLMAGIEASAVSQTPPPVGFSEVSELSPLPADAEQDRAPSSQVLARAKGVGLATLTGLGVALLLLRAPAAEPPARSLAHGAATRCTASIQVVDAPSDAEIRVRAPAPNAQFSPLAAHGPMALFPQLPCATSLEVMVRDKSHDDLRWVVIPIAAEELTARTEQAPLRVSAQRDDRIVP